MGDEQAGLEHTVSRGRLYAVLVLCAVPGFLSGVYLLWVAEQAQDMSSLRAMFSLLGLGLLPMGLGPGVQAFVLARARDVSPGRTWAMLIIGLLFPVWMLFPAIISLNLLTALLASVIWAGVIGGSLGFRYAAVVVLAGLCANALIPLLYRGSLSLEGPWRNIPNWTPAAMVLVWHGVSTAGLCIALRTDPKIARAPIETEDTDEG